MIKRASSKASAVQLLYDLQKVVRREASLSVALGLHPVVLEKVVSRAYGVMTQGQYGEAEELLVDLARVEPRAPAVPFLLGVCRFHQQDMAGAVRAFNLAIERGQVDGSPSLRQRAFLCRAQALLQIGAVDGAVNDLELAAVDGDPSLAESARAWRRQLRGNPAETGATA